MSIGVQIPLTLGMQEAFSKLITEGETALYGGLVGDNRPSLQDASKGGVGPGKAPVHPLFLVGILGGLLNTHLPGEGSQCISMQHEFLAPVFCGDRINMVIELTGLDTGKHLATLRTNCYNQEKTQVITGQAVMLVPSRMLP